VKPFSLSPWHGKARPAPLWPALLLLLVAAGCGRRDAATTAAQAAGDDSPPTVAVLTVGLRDWPRVVRVQGTLLADEHAVIGAEVAGRVEAVHVDLGSEVEPDEALATLDTEELKMQVRQSEAELAQACAKLGLTPDENEEEVDPYGISTVLEEKALRDRARSSLKRGQALAASKSIAVEELQDREALLGVAEARYLTAVNAVHEQIALIGVRRAALAQAKQTLQDAEIRAPFRGIVQERHVAPGAYLQVGQPVVTLVRIASLRFHGGVPEREALQLQMNQEVRIEVEGYPEAIEAEVSRISPAMNPANRSLSVEVDVPNPKLRFRAGLFAEAEIVVDPQAQTLAVPAAALSEFAGVEKVWVVEGGKAAQRVVQTGRRTEAWIEILKGLEAGEVAVRDARTARPGPVTITQRDPAGDKDP
jgi:RND family efflux transporter MFP subunit